MSVDSRGVAFFARLSLDGNAASYGPAMVYTADGSTSDCPVVSPFPGAESPTVPVGYITGGVDGQTVGVYQHGIVALQGLDANGDPAVLTRGARLVLTTAWESGANASVVALAQSTDDLALANGSAGIDAVACTEIPAVDATGPVGYAIVNFSGAYLSTGGTPVEPGYTTWDIVSAVPLQDPQGFGGIGVLTDITGVDGDGIPLATMALPSVTIRGQLYAQQAPGGTSGGRVQWRRLNGYRLAFLKANTAGPLLTPANTIDGELATTTDPSLAVAIGSNPDPIQDDVVYVFAFADVGRQQWIDQLRTAQGDNATLRVGNPSADTATVKLDASAAAPLVEIAARITGGVGAVLTAARAAGVSTFTLGDDESAKSIVATVTAADDSIAIDIADGCLDAVSKITGSTDGCSVALGAGAGAGASLASSVITPTGGHFKLNLGTAWDWTLPTVEVTVPTRNGRVPLAIIATASHDGIGFTQTMGVFITGTFGTKSTATKIYLYGVSSWADSEEKNVQFIAIWSE